MKNYVVINLLNLQLKMKKYKGFVNIVTFLIINTFKHKLYYVIKKVIIKPKDVRRMPNISFLPYLAEIPNFA